MVLKGVHLAATVYDSTSLREMSDVDVLVPREHLQAVVDAVAARGYRPLHGTEIDVESSVGHHLARLVKPDAAGIEVHWSVTPAGDPHAIDSTDLWTRAVPVTIGGIGVLGLCREDLLLHLCYHAAYLHQFRFGVRPFCDLAALLGTRGRAISTGRDSSRGPANGAGTAAPTSRFGSRQELIGAAVPAEALAQLQPTSFDESVTPAARAHVLSESSAGSISPGVARLAGGSARDPSRHLVDASRPVARRDRASSTDAAPRLSGCRGSTFIAGASRAAARGVGDTAARGRDSLTRRRCVPRGSAARMARFLNTHRLPLSYDYCGSATAIWGPCGEGSADQSEGPRVYRAFGLTLRSCVPLPAPDRPGWQHRRRRGQLRHGRARSARRGPTARTASGGTRNLLLTVDRIARYLVTNGRDIVIDRHPAATDADVLLYLLGSAMGALFHQRDDLVLHGSAIDIGRSAVGFLGTSGAGKSTLAAAFRQRGYPVLTDDLCVVRSTGDGALHAQPGLAQMKLWDDALERLAIPAASLARVGAGLDKRAVPVDTGFSQRALPLSRLYVLGSRDADAIELTPLEGSQRFMALMDHTFRSSYLAGLGVRASHFRRVVATAQATPVIAVRRPESSSSVGQLVARLVSDFPS